MSTYAIERKRWSPVFVLSKVKSPLDSTVELPEDYYKEYKKRLRKFIKMQNSLEFVSKEQLNEDPYYY